MLGKTLLEAVRREDEGYDEQTLNSRLAHMRGRAAYAIIPNITDLPARGRNLFARRPYTG